MNYQALPTTIASTPILKKLEILVMASINTNIINKIPPIINT